MESQTQTRVRRTRIQTQSFIDVEHQRAVFERTSTSGDIQDEACLDENDPENGDVSPTPSHYETDLKEPEYQYLLASDVRRQVRQAPAYEKPPRGKRPPGVPPKSGYPHEFFNDEELPLRTERPRSEFPILPSSGPGRPASNFRPGMEAGRVRAFYNEDDRSVFDVGYHRESTTDSGLRNDTNSVNTPFKLATYRPASYSSDTGEKRRF
ncbi:hypothetical protein CkaCkLH20_09876 [Colletotrichum karsti]|uniref:Uncharacterized protein n=1 Tax=Colletotrichum karsti TaxID=1095194 RepID=A0A9P6HWU6_9PEZI|nr:uncharacterized protein CkaCkLH20_09876 [Colletotrichum karsti]KAF9872697.1 hypothetical protein CkaCkLH20_09876 [Colletotrichum karsti]